MPKKKPSPPRKPKAEPVRVATCPGCGVTYPERNPHTEPVYECVECGKEGFDCCVPGTGAICMECEEKANA